MDLDITSYLLGKNASGGGTTINNQNITVTENGEYTADEGYTGLGTVTVNVPAPSGTINITENGTYDVTNKSSAVVNVPSGTISSFADLENACSYLLNNYIRTIPDNRNTYTNNSITLYTPHNDYKKYFIHKRVDGVRVIWVKDMAIFETRPSEISFKMVTANAYPISNNVVDLSGYPWYTGFQFYNSNFYYSQTFNDIDELITNMQTQNGLTYTLWTNSSTAGYDGTPSDTIYYSNTVAVNTNGQFITCGILSYNETISVQS